MEISSKEISISFEKVERSYQTPPGWRLATFEEATANLESIKDLLRYWDRARLLDGWIGGAYFKHAIENEFQGCMGYMLITHVHHQAISSSGDSRKYLYEDVTLSFESKLVALQLSAEDWNHEVVYWLLNSLAKTETMDPLDVRDGRIPLLNASAVDEMKNLNWMLNDLARQLWDTPFSEEEGSKMLDPRSVGDTFAKIGESCWDKFSYDRKKLLGRTFLMSMNARSALTAKFVKDDATWTVSRGWQYISYHIINIYGNFSLRGLMNKWLNDKSPQVSRSERNFILCISFIYYYYYFNRFNDSRRGDYNILDSVLDAAARFGDVIVMNKVLDCGARLQITNTWTVLHTALNADVSENKMVEMVKICLDKFKLQGKEQLVNEADDKGLRALHMASLQGKARICELLLQHGAEPDVQDTTGRLPLHYAVEEKNAQVIDLLIGKAVSEYFNRKGIEMFSFKNSDGQSPFDIAVAQNNIKLITKLLPILRQTDESYIDKVDGGKLLHECAFQGSADMVRKLLDRGVNPLDVDEEGKTALHYAAMCRDQYSAGKTVKVILSNCKDKKTLEAKVDWEGKTALHFLALRGNVDVAKWPFKDLLDKKDIYDRSPLYYLLQGKFESVLGLRSYITEMEKADIYFGDLIDSTGQTLLHVAALEGKIYLVNTLLSMSRHPRSYVRRADYLGQTALHKAAGRGHLNAIKVLLHWGAQPLLERDCDGRTAMHYAVQANSGSGGIELAELLLKKCESNERKLLFLWASAAGLGTADQILKDCDPLKAFLLDQKGQLNQNRDSTVHGNNLLKMAAYMGDTDMTKELIIRGGKIADIEDPEWIEKLVSDKKANVQKVLKEIKIIAEQGNDRPTVADNLGRDDFARSLAALLLNPYLEPPIAIGISGSWGKGKSSLMIQTEINLLKTAAQSALLPTSKLPLSSKFPGAQVLELSRKGKKKYTEVKRWVDFMKDDSKFNTNIRKPQRHRAESKSAESQVTQQDSLFELLHNYERKHHNIFKSLAAMDSSDMFTSQGQQPYTRIDSPSERSVPAVLTVQYNAWKYRTESEALAGLAVEITKEMEGIMTEPQWLSTCLRNTWRNQKQSIWIEVLFPCLLAIFLVGTFTWIVWILLDRYDAKEVVVLKYASLPATIVFMVWNLVKSVMGIVKPVSAQLMNYITLPDHSEKLGYQERVISDINFLKEEIGKKPYFLCIASSCILRFIAECCTISFLYPKFFRDTMASAKAVLASTSYASDNPRIVVFVDDLDRCQESVILQVLSAINLVLAVCKISVIVGMDKALIERAIIKKYGDKSLRNSQQLADNYLQKIIQLPLDLPDPSEDESKRFLDAQLGVFSRPNKDEDLLADAHDDVQAETDVDYDELFSIMDRDFDIRVLGDHLMKMFSPESSIQDASVSGETSAATQSKGDSKDSVAIDVPTGENTNSSRKSESALESNRKPPLKTDAGNKSFRVSIWEMLFVRYSDGERDAFCHFQKMATDCRKLPREWKRLLCYHRLVWYILSMSNEVNSLLGWQVQLITWVFTCWEWQENMNIIIENWNTIGILKTSRSDSSTPSLRAIVEYFIKEESRIRADNKDEKMPATGDDKDIARLVQDSENKELKVKDLKERGVSENIEDPESSNRQLVQVEEILNEKMPTMPDPQGDTSQSIEGDTKKVSEHSENKEAAPETLVQGMNLSINLDDPESSNRKLVRVEEIPKEKMPTMPYPQGDTSRTIEGDTKGVSEHSENKEPAPETLVEGMNISKKLDDPESNEGLQSNEVVKDQMMRETDGQADVSITRDYFESKNRAMSEKLDDVVKNVREEVEKALREEIDKTLGKEMVELHKEMDKLHKEIKELKEVKQQSEKNKKSEVERKTRLKAWLRMKSALKRYDVSMQGIRAFQRFRFYCAAGYLPWPLPNEENEDLRFLQTAR